VTGARGVSSSVDSGSPAIVRRRRSDEGSVTAETAVVLPALVLLLVLLLWGLSVGSAQVRCVDASRVAARALARGEDPAVATSAALDAAPVGARVEVSVGASQVTVRVTATAPGPGSLGGSTGAVTVSASATAAREDVPGGGVGPR
jgi:Flp pilus assembly protein TadG